jgi:hypothetical protein
MISRTSVDTLVLMILFYFLNFGAVRLSYARTWVLMIFMNKIMPDHSASVVEFFGFWVLDIKAQIRIKYMFCEAG